ncbi:DUF2784 domain-containing protein [Bordetella bronchiseptica]|uniref:DUF2784 domain-containing protein n=1 Tax=Bordetella bronchiseptica TaxID=518 RepID=UPI00045B47FA|nr:DUF2784 domain-containing protein [Bordetella bronchiseptica]KAK53281.1 PF10861 family protein [Bordetella bronchiseptica OSU054]KDB71848.1 PF10861 family protein [Bordetella bronchiseptica CA90 BB1334]KDD48531.1 PF10861 family protein [Bordetella bronchiseptica OSU095]KDD86204.1 PF10861 family protein [Bordetella bronchiseptica MO275]QET71747.1 DUF2784 domain-containing protein [Bordetella bronchiseptica]
MLYRFLADLVLALHALFVAFVVLGGLLALRWPRLAWLHVPAALWGAGIMLAGAICPLTPLENHWRAQAGQQGYEDGFIAHYLLAAIYPEGLSRTAQTVLGGLALAGNALVYAALWRRRRRGGIGR